MDMRTSIPGACLTARSLKNLAMAHLDAGLPKVLGDVRELVVLPHEVTASMCMIPEPLISHPIQNNKDIRTDSGVSKAFCFDTAAYWLKPFTSKTLSRLIVLQPSWMAVMVVSWQIVE